MHQESGLARANLPPRERWLAKADAAMQEAVVEALRRDVPHHNAVRLTQNARPKPTSVTGIRRCMGV